MTKTNIAMENGQDKEKYYFPHLGPPFRKFNFFPTFYLKCLFSKYLDFRETMYRIKFTFIQIKLSIAILHQTLIQHKSNITYKF